MNKIDRLIQSYGQYIAIPWRTDAAAAQRVIFCVYPETEELRLRGRIDEFEIVTREAGHDWLRFDLSDTFAHWLSSQRYAKNYFQKPHLLPSILPNYLDFLVESFDEFLKAHEAGENAVAAVSGVGSLFGFLKVKNLADRLAPKTRGRLLVLFPGSYENNNYRLLDGYDGWNYLAVPISGDKDW